ncbi:MAG TPA: L-threonylcarbamoyladenylate synthase [Tissierellaceae bacterium]
METKVYKVQEDNIDLNIIKQAADIIKSGQLVSFPTETVYGLGADGLNEEAVKKIYKAKGRPSDNPLILHISEISELDNLVCEVSEEAKLCIKEFWPGPLTMIFKKSKIVPDIITGGLDTVAIRMPSNKIAKELIKHSNTPIAAPSANLSGRPSPTSADHVYEDLNGKIGLIIDGGRCDVGLESTVLDVSGNIPMILRPGKVSYEDLIKILPNTIIDKSILKDGEIPKSPGQKYKHYAPKGQMLVFIGENEKVVSKIKEESRKYTKNGNKVAIIATDESIKEYTTTDGLVLSIGSRHNIKSIGKNLFEVLRKCDDENIDVILSEGFEKDNLGMAIMNRMLKASGGNIIKIK